MAKIKVIADENVHMAIVEGLKRRGVTAWSVQTAGRSGLSDEEQLEYTTSQGACLLTHDDDLLILADQWRKNGRRHGGIIYVHQQALKIGEIIRRIKTLVDLNTAEEMGSHI